MEKSSPILTKRRDESGTPGLSGDFRYNVRLNCTCPAFDAKIKES